MLNVLRLNPNTCTANTGIDTLLEPKSKHRVCVGFLLYIGAPTLLTFMAKRRADDPLLHDSPSKRCCPSLCTVDMQLGSMAPTGGVSPPSLLALLGSRSRKRPYYFEDPEKQEETAIYRKATHCDTRKPAASVLTVQTSGSFQERRGSSALTSCKKRAREDCVGSETVTPKANDKVSC